MFKALIIDDERPVQIAVSKLGRWSYYGIEPPATAINGKDGLSCMRELHPDVVFVDMNMPVMDGCTFLEKPITNFRTASTSLSADMTNSIMPSRHSVSVHAIICSNPLKKMP